MLPACRWPSTYSTSGCMIWYDKGVSLVWIDTYPSRFFTLHIHFFGLNNAGDYNEYHICNGIWSKKKHYYCCLLLTQHKYYFWNSAAFAYSSIDLTVKENIYFLCASFFFSNPPPPPKKKKKSKKKPQMLQVVQHIGPWQMFKVFQKCKFCIQVTDWILEHFLWNCSQVHAT